MKSLVVTVAGCASRFNQDTSSQALKSLYYIDSPKNSLLYQILDKSRDVEEIIVVGGFLYEELCRFVHDNCDDFLGRIKTVYNPYYSEYGSGYSLIKGIEAVSPLTDEIIFVEGDLYFDANDFSLVKSSPMAVITTNNETIRAHKAVVLYEDLEGGVHYVYDTGHQALSIHEPFLAIYNSGQIWKFVEIHRLKTAIKSLSPKQEQGTNLEIIQRYFDKLDKTQFVIIPLRIWNNCNTVDDYNNVYNRFLR